MEGLSCDDQTQQLTPKIYYLLYRYNCWCFFFLNRRVLLLQSSTDNLILFYKVTLHRIIK